MKSQQNSAYRNTPLEGRGCREATGEGDAWILVENLLAEIVRASGLTKPTAHRITTMLAEMGFIERDSLKRGLIEGPRLIRLAMNTLTSAAPRNMRHSILRSVSDEIGETCNFGVLAGSEVIYLDRVEAKWPLGLRFEAGSRVPAHCTALGKIVLAAFLAGREEDADVEQSVLRP